MKAACRITAAAVIALLAPVSAFADVPVWRIVKGDHSEYKILADPKISRDQRLAFLLDARLHEAEKAVREWEEFAREAIKEKTYSSRRQSVEKKLQLLGMTDNYAAILTREAECSGNCQSGESVAIYSFSKQAPLKPSEVLEIDNQAALLNKLSKRDRDLLIGPFEVTCNRSQKSSDEEQSNCRSLDSMLGPAEDENQAIRFRSSRDVRNFVEGIDVGFTSDDTGRVTKLDLYIRSDRRFPSHFQAYRWSIDIEDAAPLLKVALRAADTKPDFAIKTKTVETSVTLDAKIKADPVLAADCLAEGKKWAAARRAEAEKERKQDPGLFRNAWSYDRKYETRSVVDGRYVSIVRGDYEYTGGAHPNSSSNTILWDRSAGKRISIRPFFTETADNGPTLKAMRLGVIASLKEEKKARGAEGLDEGAIDGIEAKLLKIGPVALAPSTEEGKSSGLNFYYAPYAVGSYAEGEYVAFVPWETLKPYLTPEGAKIFGGTRPKDDPDGMR